MERRDFHTKVMALSQNTFFSNQSYHTIEDTQVHRPMCSKSLRNSVFFGLNSMIGKDRYEMSLEHVVRASWYSGHTRRICPSLRRARKQTVGLDSTLM